MYFCHVLESWQSGRSWQTRNLLYRLRYRGFESLTLRKEKNSQSELARSDKVKGIPLQACLRAHPLYFIK